MHTLVFTQDWIVTTLFESTSECKPIQGEKSALKSV